VEKREEQLDDDEWNTFTLVHMTMTMTRIVAGLVLRRQSMDDGDVMELLLIQEAKKSCRGKWYLPAGRMESGETPEAATRREMLEESGFEVHVEHFLAVELQGISWIRFAFTCSITGGQLKTVADQESLCAQWYPVDDVLKGKLDTRANDFFPLVEKAIRRLHCPLRSSILPVLIDRPVHGFVFELLLFRRLTDDSFQVAILMEKAKRRADDPTEKDEAELLQMENVWPRIECGSQLALQIAIADAYRTMTGQKMTKLPQHVVQVLYSPRSPGLSLRLAIAVPMNDNKETGPMKDLFWLNVSNARQLIYLDQFGPWLHLL